MIEGLLGNVGGAIGSAFGGASDFLLNRGRYAEPGAMNAQYGVPEADVRQAGINTLANVSALLLAAGQPMTGAQRGQMLAQIGPAMGGMTTDLFKSSQARLMLSQQRAAMEEARGLAALGQRMKDNPQEIADLIGRPVGFVTVSTPGAIKEIMKKQASVDPLERRKLELDIAARQRTETTEASLREMLPGLLEKDPRYQGEANAAARALIINTPSLRDEYIKGLQRPSAQWREATRPGVDGKPLVGQVNITTGEFKPYTQGGVQILPAEKAEEAETGKLAAKQRSELIESGSRAPVQISRLNLMERIVDSVNTGKWADVKANIVASARALGLNDETIKMIGGLNPNLPASQQTLASLSNDLTVGMIGPGGFPANNFSDADRKFLSEIFPQFTNEPGANKIKLEVLRRVERRKVEKVTAWRDYQRKEKAAGRRPDFFEFEQNFLEAQEGKDLFADLLPRAPSVGTSAPPSGTANGINWRVAQ